MKESSTSPFPIKGIPFPLLRPLPTIFGFGRLTIGDPKAAFPEARRLFTAHLRAFKAILIATTRTTPLVPEVIRPILLRCNALNRSCGTDLWANMEAFEVELLGLINEHGRLIKEGAEAHQERLRELFRTETGPCKLATVFSRPRRVSSLSRGNSCRNGAAEGNDQRARAQDGASLPAKGMPGFAR